MRVGIPQDILAVHALCAVLFFVLCVFLHEGWKMIPKRAPSLCRVFPCKKHGKSFRSDPRLLAMCLFARSVENDSENTAPLYLLYVYVYLQEAFKKYPPLPVVCLFAGSMENELEKSPRTATAIKPHVLCFEE